MRRSSLAFTTSLSQADVGVGDEWLLCCADGVGRSSLCMRQHFSQHFFGILCQSLDTQLSVTFERETEMTRSTSSFFQG